VEEDLRIIEFNPALADDKMMTRRNHLIDDRRPEFYESICRPGEEEEPAGAPSEPPGTPPSELST